MAIPRVAVHSLLHALGPVRDAASDRRKRGGLRLSLGRGIGRDQHRLRAGGHRPGAVRPRGTKPAEGRTVLALAKAGVAVYSPHTAFDNARGGINERLAARLGLTDLAPLRHRDGPGRCKVVVFVPDADLGKVSDAMFAAGAGVIGEYRECSFRLAGTGTFFGGDAANPTVGEKGRREDVAEWRLEVVCPEAAV